MGKAFGQSEREDIQRLEAVRRAVGDDVAICVDANNGCYSKQAIYVAKEFERYQVGWFEEPVLACATPNLKVVEYMNVAPRAMLGDSRPCRRSSLSRGCHRSTTDT